MPSRLSSLLVRDGLVGVKRMEKAFQRQVIYGGSLDTILLEMSLVPEERLTQYLALASGLPPAERHEGASIDPAAVAAIPREIAERYRAAPLSIEGETVRILVCSPLEITELEDLADQLDRPLQPLIAPEYRWHLVFSSAYGLDPPARFTTLARSLEVDATLTPVGRAKTVIVEDRGDAAPVGVISGDLTERTPALADATKRIPTGDRPPAAVTTLPMPAVTPAAEPAPPPVPPAAADLRGRTSTLIGVKPVRAGADSAPPPPPRPPRDGVPDEPVTRPSITFLQPGTGLQPAKGLQPKPGTPSTGVPRPVPESGPAKRPSGRMSPLSKHPPSQPIATDGRDEPLAIQAAREQLATADDRDTVFLTLLRAARTRARWAGLLTVQGGAAIGRLAIAEPGLDTAAVNTVLIPLDATSAFRAVVSNHQPHVGALVSGDPGIDAMVLRLGGTMPPSALLLPIVLRDRVVAIVIAHRVHSDLALPDVTELLPLALAASDALGRLIVKHKSAGYRAPVDAAVVDIDAELVDTKRYNAVREDGSPWRAPERDSVPAIEDGIDVAITADPTRPIEVILDEIEGAREGHAEDALADAVDHAREALGELNRRFPGKLRIDRFAVAGRPLRAAQYGGLLELVVRLGSVSADLLIDKMASPQRDIRFYATICTAELRPRTAVYALAERLFDQDFGVRACAIEALSGYPVQDLSTALARARRAVHSSDPEVVAAATAAIVELGDTEAVEELITALERSDRAAEHARRALVALTAQDFGSSARKWRKWYEGARGQHRIEWLIDGLVHKDDAIREIAINDLRRLTGEYFGYHHDLPRRERDAAAGRWVTWWRDAGHRRFVIREDERHRPTAQLPARRDPS